MKLTFNGHIKDGKMHIVHRSLFDEQVKIFDGKDIILTVERKKKKRSSNQNGYYWGVIIPAFMYEFSKAMGEPVSDTTTHETLKNRFNSKEIVNEKTGEVITVARSTTELTTTEFEVYLDECRMFMAEFFDVSIPLPNEQGEIFN